jgi:hypothetical protein
MLTATCPSNNHRPGRILRDFARVAFAREEVWNVVVLSWVAFRSCCAVRPSPSGNSNVLQMHDKMLGMSGIGAGLQTLGCIYFAVVKIARPDFPEPIQ